jgi:hypothetical protein
VIPHEGWCSESASGRTKPSILNEEDNFQNRAFFELKRPFSKSIITAEAPRAQRGYTAFSSQEPTFLAASSVFGSESFSGQAPTFEICFLH